MTVCDTTQLSDAIAAFSEATEKAFENACADDFEALSRHLDKLDSTVREVQQQMWSDQAWETVRRLEKGKPLEPADHDVIRTFLISDAEHYLAMENNFEDWVAELRRLNTDLARRATMVDARSIGELRGLIKDAIRLLPDIQNFYEEQRRIDKFEQATESLDESSRQMLVRLLKEQLTRKDR